MWLRRPAAGRDGGVPACGAFREVGPCCACKIVKKQENAFVRTTIELSDPLFREVKATAARQGIRLKDYIAEALQAKLAINPPAIEKPWMKFFGIAANDPEMVAELHQLDQIVAEHFEAIEEGEWDCK